MGVLYLMLRGSKLMWWLGVILGTLGAWGSIETSFANRSVAGMMSPSPSEQLTIGILNALFVILLLLPSTRRFFNLEWRKRHLETTS
jgi:hypothetical protein